jgi:(p)ppGpp synthase/HD superfamily hydrolase
MSDMDRAIAIALEAHKDQLDRGGKPYILHPLRVMLSMETEAEQIAAVLHDVVEDRDTVGLGDILALFGDDIHDAVDCLTRRDGERYMDYVARAAMNPISRKVKLADLRDNTLPERAGGLTDALRARYNAALALLALPVGDGQ